MNDPLAHQRNMLSDAYHREMVLENGSLLVKIRELEKRNENQVKLIQQLQKIISEIGENHDRDNHNDKDHRGNLSPQVPPI